MLTARQLEQGGSGLSGRLGDGAGKWQLTVSASSPIQVMSLMRSTTGLLSNLSRGGGMVPAGANPPPPVNQPDMVIRSLSIQGANPSPGEPIALQATVDNRGARDAASTTLRFFRSSDATISTADTEVGAVAVSGLPASGSSRVETNSTVSGENSTDCGLNPRTGSALSSAEAAVLAFCKDTQGLRNCTIRASGAIPSPDRILMATRQLSAHGRTISDMRDCGCGSWVIRRATWEHVWSSSCLNLLGRLPRQCRTTNPLLDLHSTTGNQRLIR